ncbi:hypothetical protein GGX14DRAFT_449577, partial [Mycena pura]
MTYLLRIGGYRRLFTAFPTIRVLHLSTYRTCQNHLEFKAHNESLVDCVQKEQFAAAERLRVHLASAFAPIEPHPVYERAALAQIRRPGKQDLEAFLMWLHLVPDNENPSRVEKGPLTKTRNVLFRTGSPARNLLLITEFSLVCAAKGYGQLVWDDLVFLIGRFQHAQKAVDFFLAFESALLQYYAKYYPGQVEHIVNRQRHLLVMLCCDAGWLEEAVQVVKDSSAYRIKQAGERLIGLLRARGDVASVALVKKCLSKSTSDIDPGNGLQRKPSTVQLFSTSTESREVAHSFYSTRSIIEGSKTLRSRTWIASKLRQVKNLLSQRSLVHFRPPGSELHSIMAHYDACKGYRRGLITLQKRALSASDPCSYTWLCKEMFYLHESRKYADIVALFGLNFRTDFLPPKPWQTVRETAAPSEPSRIAHTVPTKLEILPADAWVVWNALVRLSVFTATPLPVLQTLHHSVVHYSSTLTDRQFRAYPTSYTTVFRSIIWAYGEIGEVDRAVATTRDVNLIGKLHPSNVGLLDELAAVHARSSNVAAATRLLTSLEEIGPRLATYGVMMDAYLHAGLADEALQLERRMKQKCAYVPGVNWRMDATLSKLAALRAEEDALDPELP